MFTSVLATVFGVVVAASMLNDGALITVELQRKPIDSIHIRIIGDTTYLPKSGWYPKIGDTLTFTDIDVESSDDTMYVEAPEVPVATQKDSVHIYR